MNTLHSTFEEIATLASKHRLVPFLGAGCSFQHVGLDWNLLATEMAKEAACDPKESPILIAQRYVDRFSREKLCELLTTKLHVTGFEDAKGETLLALMSLNLGSIYTTNQDNVFEHCCKKYGRPYVAVKTIEDLAEVLPGDRLYVKFHGDLSVPESVVFTDADYTNRMRSSDHFLDIRLKSDLLTKSFLFIGYSFRDPNIQQLFSSLNTLFKGKLPPAFFVPWQYDPMLEELTQKYGVRIVNTQEIFPDAKTPQDSFDRFFIELAKINHQKKTTDQIEEMFHPKIPYSRRVIGKYDVIAVEASCEAEDVEAAVHKFRATCDTSLIPDGYQEQLTEVLVKLASKVATEAESDQICGALTHLKMKSPVLRFRVLAAVFATANVRKKSGGLGDRFHPHIEGVPEEYHLLTVCQAVTLLQDWGRAVKDGFSSRISRWIDDKLCVDEYPSELQQDIKSKIDWAWKGIGHTTLEHPLVRQARLKALPSGNRKTWSRTREQITEDLMGAMPKTFRKPHEG